MLCGVSIMLCFVLVLFDSFVMALTSQDQWHQQYYGTWSGGFEPYLELMPVCTGAVSWLQL